MYILYQPWFKAQINATPQTKQKKWFENFERKCITLKSIRKYENPPEE